MAKRDYRDDMNNETFRGRLVEAIDRRQLTFYELSKSSKVPLTTLIHIIDGSTKNPGIFTVVKLCDVLEISVDELMKRN